MIQVECIRRNKDTNGKISSYILRYNTGKRFKISRERLKELLASNQIYVYNLKLTKDGRIVVSPMEVDLLTQSTNDFNTLWDYMQTIPPSLDWTHTLDGVIFLLIFRFKC